MIYYESGGNGCVKLYPLEMRLIQALPDRRAGINNCLSAHGFDVSRPYNERLEGKDTIYYQPKELGILKKT